MEIRHLSNSGFAVAHEHGMLLIDCFNYKRWERRLLPYFHICTDITALFTHSHADHWDPAAAATVRQLGGEVAGWEGIEEIDVPLRKGDARTLNGIRVTAFGSTDEGLSFLIDWAGIRLFHAGDLNFWHWREESTAAEVAEAEAAFAAELGDIAAAVPAGTVAAAFFPVDPRMGEGYWEGAVRFCRAIKPRYLFPMHFGGEFAAPAEFYAAMAEAAPDTRVWANTGVVLVLRAPEE